LLQAKTFQQYVKLNFDGPDALDQENVKQTDRKSSMGSKKVQKSEQAKQSKQDSEVMVPNFQTS